MLVPGRAVVACAKLFSLRGGAPCSRQPVRGLIVKSGKSRETIAAAASSNPTAQPCTDPLLRLALEPIGYVRGGLATKVEAARQPAAANGAPARIELMSGRNLEHALEDLTRWDLIWVIFWFHLNSGWRPKVLPPRSTTGRKGVFATRSPHRPNPLGLSVVRLERVDGLTLHIRNADMLDGTPVLDLKPYVAYADAHPDAGTGWLHAGRSGSLDRPSDPVRAYTIAFEPLATEQARWIEAQTGLAIGERIHSTLSLGPAPHPYRRIRSMDCYMQLSVKEWRVRFIVTELDIRVLEIHTGFRPSQLARAAPDETLQRHRKFVEMWPPSK